jgi:hypothetical protein
MGLGGASKECVFVLSPYIPTDDWLRPRAENMTMIPIRIKTTLSIFNNKFRSRVAVVVIESVITARLV